MPAAFCGICCISSCSATQRCVIVGTMVAMSVGVAAGVGFEGSPGEVGTSVGVKVAERTQF